MQVKVKQLVLLLAMALYLLHQVDLPEVPLFLGGYWDIQQFYHTVYGSANQGGNP
jgi:hypothetical protein